MNNLKNEIKDKIETEISNTLFDVCENNGSLIENKMRDSLKALNTIIFEHTFEYMCSRFNAKAIKRISVNDWINHLYYFYNGLDQNNESTDYKRMA